MTLPPLTLQRDGILARCLGTILLLVLPWISLSPTVHAIESNWTVTGTTTDWFSAPWTNGVPHQPGDVAILSGGSANVRAGLSAQATLGELRLGGSSNLAIQGAGGLHFDRPANSAPRILGNATRGLVNYDLATPVSIASGQELLLELNGRSVLRLAGGIAAGDESIRTKGEGVTILPAASPDWSGNLYMDAGEVRVEHTQALANASSVVVATGARFTVVSQYATPEESRDWYQIPLIKLNGGTLQTNLGANLDATTVDSNIELLSNSVVQVATGDLLSIRGNISGTGGLTFQRRTDAASQYTYTTVFIDGDTSYAGETVVGPNTWVEFYRPTALGDASAGTKVLGGTLIMHQGGGGEDILVERGEVRLVGAATPYGHRIKLDSGRLSGGETPPAKLNTNVEYLHGAVLGTEAGGDNLVIAGNVHGTGSLAIQNDVEIQGGVSARGNLYIRNRSGAKLSGPLNLAGEVFVDQRGLQILGDIDGEDDRFRIATTAETADASVSFASNNTVRSIVLDPRQANREGTFDRSAVIVNPGTSLTITNELRFMGGRLQGQFKGQAILNKQDRATGILEDIAGSDFERVNVEAGGLSIRGNTGLSPPEIHLQEHDTSRVSLWNTGVFTGDIHLNNSQGYLGAALHISGTTDFEGNIFLGSTGASISGDSRDGAAIGPNAIIHGGDLSVVGYSQLRIRGGNHAYTGATKVGGEELVLVDGGRLNSTSEIIGFGRISGGGGRSTLVLDNSGTANLNDRIPDATPVHLNGMVLKLVGNTNGSASEVLGEVHATRGASDLVIESPNPAHATELKINSLNRQAGGAVQFRKNSEAGRFIFETAPQLDDGLIGGWAVVDGNEFATYGPNGVVGYGALHNYATDLASATASDNVRPTSSQNVLSSDRTINSLTTNQDEVTLNGHRLTVASGGMLSRSYIPTSIKGPGQLTAGTAAGAELLVAGSFHIEADIVDNAMGAVGLTHSRGGSGTSAYLNLSGHNTYSGPTVVNSAAVLEIASEQALPAGGDVFLNGGDLRLNYQPTAPLELGRLELRDWTLIRATGSSQHRLRPESVLVESSQVEVSIIGDAPITKVGPSSAHFGSSLALHTGPISIEDGDFHIEAIGSAPTDDAHAITIHRGASLRNNNDWVIAGRKIRLDGGSIDVELRGGVSAPIEVLSGGGSFRNERGLSVVSSPISGSGPLVVEGGFGNGIVQFSSDLSNFTGPLDFTGGAIYVTGNLKYDGEIDVRAADLTTAGGTPFGNSSVLLHPEAQLSIGEPLTANLQLKGGVLRMHFDNTLRSPVLKGQLSVSDHSYLYIQPGYDGNETRPRIESSVELFDGSNLVITASPDSYSDVVGGLFREELFIQSDIKVSGVATLTSFDSVVEIAGTITPTTQNAELRLIGNNTFNLRSSVVIPEGTSLALVQDDAPGTFQFNKLGQQLSGNGTIIGNIEFASGGILAPGSSPGTLTVEGDVKVGPGSQFRWDVDSPSEFAGVVGDLLRIDGDMSFETTAFGKLLFQLNALPDLDQLRNNPMLIVAANSIRSFNPAYVSISVAGLSSDASSFAAPRFVMSSDGSNLYLHLVPEPASATLLAVIAAAALIHRQGRRPGVA